MDTALADIVRATRASAALLYVLTPDRTALWLSHVTGAPREVVAPWSRVAVGDPIPVADAVREERLVWVNDQVEMARRYPRPAVVLPYDFALAAVPVASDSGVRGGLVLLWPSGHPSRLSRAEHDALRTGSRRLGHLFEQAARRGEPLVTPGRPRILPPEPGRTPTAEEAWAGTALLDRLPGGYVALDLNGRITLVTPAAADLVGAEPDRLLGSLPWEVLPWMDVPHVEDRYRAALISRTPQTFRVLRPPGTWLSFELYPDPSGISVRIEHTGDGPQDGPVVETAQGPAGPRCCTT